MTDTETDRKIYRTDRDSQKTHDERDTYIHIDRQTETETEIEKKERKKERKKVKRKERKKESKKERKKE